MKPQTKLFNKPLLLRESAIHKFSEDAMSEMSADRIDELMGLKSEPLTLAIVDGIARIVIKGALSKDVAEWEKIFYGYQDIGEIGTLIDAAVESQEAKAILLCIDSPGGSVSLIPEVAKKIRAARAIKPVIAYTDGLMCSAAMWLGAQANVIYASTSAEVGSIGVYTLLMDMSKLYENAGVKPILIKAGKNKAIGIQGLPVTEEQVSIIQDGVNYIYDMFKKDVVGGRGRKIDDEDMQGLDWYAEIAKQKGLVDEIYDSEAEVIEQIKLLIN